MSFFPSLMVGGNCSCIQSNICTPNHILHSSSSSDPSGSIISSLAAPTLLRGHSHSWHLSAPLCAGLFPLSDLWAFAQASPHSSAGWLPERRIPSKAAASLALKFNPRGGFSKTEGQMAEAKRERSPHHCEHSLFLMTPSTLSAAKAQGCPKRGHWFGSHMVVGSGRQRDCFQIVNYCFTRSCSKLANTLVHSEQIFGRGSKPQHLGFAGVAS